jgi:hypothetical protein
LAATVTGTVSRSDLKLLPNARVQLRNVGTGRLVASTLSGQAGEFSFTSVQPGNYIVEVLDSSYRVLGMTAPFTVTPGASLTASIVAVAPAAATGARGGFSLLGLGPVASMAVLGAAGTAGVTAVVATQPEASPSR